MSKKQPASGKEIVQKGLKPAVLPETKNGPGGIQKLPPQKAPPNPFHKGPKLQPGFPTRRK